MRCSNAQTLTQCTPRNCKKRETMSRVADNGVDSGLGSGSRMRLPESYLHYERQWHRPREQELRVQFRERSRGA